MQVSGEQEMADEQPADRRLPQYCAKKGMSHDRYQPALTLIKQNHVHVSRDVIREGFTATPPHTSMGPPLSSTEHDAVNLSSFCFTHFPQIQVNLQLFQGQDNKCFQCRL